jgi:predicted extracellular nuclease
MSQKYKNIEPNFKNDNKPNARHKFLGDNMKLRYPALLAICCTTAINLASADEVWLEDFSNTELDGIGAVGPDNALSESDEARWTIDVSGAELSATSDWFRVENEVFEGRDLDGKAVWTSEEIDIIGLADVSFSLDAIDDGDHESNDYFDVAYSVDGGEFVTILNWEDFGSGSHTLIGDTPNDADWGSVTVSQNVGAGDSLRIRVSMFNGAGTERLQLDNVSVVSGEVLVVDDAPEASISLVGGEINVAVDANIVVTFSESVVASAWNSVVCELAGNIPVTASGEGTSYTLNPDTDFSSTDSCSFTISAGDVTDLDGEPDNLAEDVTVTFSVVDTSAVVELVINEFQADPASGLSGDANGDGIRNFSEDEFVELVNAGSVDLDLSGWILRDGSSMVHTFPSDSIVEAGCAVVVFGGGVPQGVFGGALVQTASSGGVSLSNGGDTITMTNGASTFVVGYGSEGGNDQSLNLNPDITGESFVRHSTIETSGGALYSPGTQLDGSNFVGCTLPDIAPTVSNVSPADGAIDVSVDSLISLSFSEEVVVSEWPNLSCAVSGDVALNGALSGTDFTLTPAAALSGSEICTLTLLANSVADIDGSADSLTTDFTTSFTAAEVLVCAAPETYTLISTVQGSGSASPLVGESVRVQAVVTAVISDEDGDTIVIQEEDADQDGDPSTSEGVFVFNRNNAFTSTVAVGDVVAVKGNVSEFFDRTQITLASVPIVCGNAATTPALFSLPVTTLDDLEALEGMLVSSSQPLVVTDNFTLARFGQVTLSTERLFNPTNIFAPGSTEAIDLEAANALNRIVLDDGDSTQNPGVVVFPTGGLSAANPLRLGDTVALLTGVVDFAFGDYRVIPTQDPTFVATNLRTAEPDLNLGNLKVASLNVLNYFNGIDGSGSVCGPTANSGCRGADSDLEFERQKAKTVTAIVSMDADIVGLMEIENNGFSAGSAIADLVAAINAIMGAGTYSIVDPGAAIGTDAITVAFIYKPSVVSLAGPSQILDSSNSISDEDGVVLFVDTKNRPSLVQEFALVENGETLVISVNHLKSKSTRSGCGSGDDDTTTGQGGCNLTRTRAAQALSAFLDTQYPDKATLIIGDLNAYAKEDPIRELEGAGYTNLVNYFGGVEAYSYSFSGLLGYLDHALANNKALAKVVDVTEWHINADEPIALDYNVENKSEAQVTDFYADDAYRMSDHDPVLIAMQFDVAVIAPATDADVNQDGSIDFSDYMAIVGMLGSTIGDANFDTIADFDTDGTISFADLQAWYQLYLAQ